jgi:hypothetical protein
MAAGQRCLCQRPAVLTDGWAADPLILPSGLLHCCSNCEGQLVYVANNECLEPCNQGTSSASDSMVVEGASSSGAPQAHTLCGLLPGWQGGI